MHQTALRTRVCELLGITVPVIGAPMGGVAGPELTAAVSAAGGLGVLGHANTPVDEVRAQIRQVRARTDQPFGVGLLFPGGDAGAERGDSGTTAGAQPAEHATPSALPEFLRPLWEAAGASPAPGDSDESRRLARFRPEQAQQRLDIVIEEQVPVLVCGLGTPAAVVQRAHAHGIQVVSLVGSRRAAVEVAARGVDVVVAQGHEAGGHTGRTPTFVLTPQVADAVAVPVVAAGGVSDGRGLAAALMLGGSGVVLGTRLLATPEARTAEVHKQQVVAMQEDDTVVSRCYTGKPSRVLRNAFTDAWRGHESEILPMPGQWDRVAPLVEPAKAAGRLDLANWPTGQGAVLVDGLTPADEVVRQVAAHAAALLASAPEVVV